MIITTSFFLIAHKGGSPSNTHTRPWHKRDEFGIVPVPLWYLKALLGKKNLLNIVVSSMSSVETCALMGLLNLDYDKKKENKKGSSPTQRSWMPQDDWVMLKENLPALTYPCGRRESDSSRGHRGLCSVNMLSWSQPASTPERAMRAFLLFPFLVYPFPDWYYTLFSNMKCTAHR